MTARKPRRIQCAEALRCIGDGTSNGRGDDVPLRKALTAALSPVTDRAAQNAAHPGGGAGAWHRTTRRTPTGSCRWRTPKDTASAGGFSRAGRPENGRSRSPRPSSVSASDSPSASAPRHAVPARVWRCRYGCGRTRDSSTPTRRATTSTRTPDIAASSTRSPSISQRRYRARKRGPANALCAR
jgi:hypothetical protein